MEGFFNKILRINLKTKTFKGKIIPDSIHETYLGGKGLVAYLMEIIVPKEWFLLLDVLKEEKGSEKVRQRSMEERRMNKANKFRDYFKDSVIQELAIEEIQIEGEVIDPTGECIPLDWSLRIHGLLIGLKDSNDETLALGIIKNYFEEKKVVRVSTPLRDILSVKTIQLSPLKVIPLYEKD